MNNYKILTIGVALLVLTVAAQGLVYAQGELVAKPDMSYGAADRRDPFIDLLPKDLPLPQIEEPGMEGIKPPEMVIQGIFWGGQFPQAIVNAKVVKVGDTIEGATVVGIEKDGITIRVSSREFRMPAPASQIVVPAASRGPQESEGGYSRDAVNAAPLQHPFPTIEEQEEEYHGPSQY